MVSGGFTQAPEAAERPQASDFPAPDGRTLQEIADLSKPGGELAFATSHYVVGDNRIAFGILNRAREFAYAPTAIYVGRSPQDTAEGPFLAPADSLITKAAFRSQTAAQEGDAIASIYSTEVDLPERGRYAILALSRFDEGLLGATAHLEVSSADEIPAPGEPAPVIETDTIEDAAGQIERIDTRVPPSDMHANFADVVGKRPVALLFATPALCQSRVCGPVTDIAVQLKAEYGDRVEFIHQEVFVDNDVGRGLREPLQRFNLRTEPWLFTLDAEGTVVARLEGSFGINEFERAVQAAL